jgi:hypothetical protein
MVMDRKPKAVEKALTNKPWVAQALLPVLRLMHSMHRTQAGVPVSLKPEPATDEAR